MPRDATPYLVDLEELLSEDERIVWSSARDFGKRRIAPFFDDLDGFGFDGVAGFDTLVPVVINGVSGEVEQGELLFEGSNFATIRIIDKPEPESPDLADVEIDYDGDGEIDAIELWTWFGDIFPP